MIQRWFRVRGLTALGAAVKGARESVGLSQSELAEHIGSSRPTLSRLERGVPVTTEVLTKTLARAGYEIYVVPRSAHVRVEFDDAG
ncbi:helix-turn-helix domain-containing protein [Promicromonospora sp. NPDC060204]|uniref:helix-turn-helix domain-containing protein n=1 Tax=Promicromonospora sp. NPDC060204 TaxID=3347071 RepID=UPI003649A5FB